MKYYTINNDKSTIYAGNVNDGVNDITEYYIRRSDGSYRKYVDHDSSIDFRCFEALKSGKLQTFATLDLAQHS